MNMQEQIKAFNANYADLCDFATKQGYFFSVLNEGDLHKEVMLIELKEDDEEILYEDPEDYAFLADYWESLSPRNRNGRSYPNPRCGLFERVRD